MFLYFIMLSNIQQKAMKNYTSTHTQMTFYFVGGYFNFECFLLHDGQHIEVKNVIEVTVKLKLRQSSSCCCAC